MSTLPIAEHVHLAEILQEEMDERGWTRDDVALRMGSSEEFGINRLALDFLMELREPNMLLGNMDEQLSQAFGISAEFFNNFHDAWRAAQPQATLSGTGDGK